MKRVAVLVAGIALVAVGLAQIQKGKTRPLDTRNWMRAVNQPYCKALGDLLKEPGPADGKAWEMAAQHAQVLNEAGHVLMADGRCPDATWLNAAKDLREGSEAVLKAVEAKNAAEARTAFKTVLNACQGCHSAHRKSTPAKN